jgi:hypothetical protein
MSERILLSSYVVKIVDSSKCDQILSNFNGSVDFLSTFQQFTSEIFRNIEKQADIHNITTLHLTLDSPATVEAKDRKIYGYFSSGISGERFDVRDLDTNETELEVEPSKHGSFRNIFFYLFIPREKRIGYLILQRKAKFGIKTILKRILNKYIHEHGFSNYYVEINNLLHSSVYEKMIQEGNLKKVDLIKKRIPNSIEEYFKNGKTHDTKGTLRTSISTHTGLSGKWKEFIDQLFRNHNDNTRIEIKGGDEELDEIEFELELNGKKKTFHIVNHQRTQPDVDVTTNVQFENGEPTMDSLISEAQSLIDDMLEVKVPHV